MRIGKILSSSSESALLIPSFRAGKVPGTNHESRRQLFAFNAMDELERKFLRNKVYECFSQGEHVTSQHQDDVSLAEDIIVRCSDAFELSNEFSMEYFHHIIEVRIESRICC